MKIDFTGMVPPTASPERGASPEGTGGARNELLRDAWTTFDRLRAGGELGFLDLPRRGVEVDAVLAMAERFEGRCDDLVILGIGGSALGTAMLRDALRGEGWNFGDPERREGLPRLHVLDNIDPHTIADLLSRLDPERTLFNVVSKSGSTAETMAQFLVAEGWLAGRLGEDAIPSHFLFTTDPARGALRRIASERGIPALPVPPNVGGRFSVLSPVGLFPAAMIGIDPFPLLAGAATAAERAEADPRIGTEVSRFAHLLHHAERDGRPIHVMMPYLDRLRTFAFWFQQLWAESLGKEGGGPTPLPALGATDQHSQLQLLMEGPDDKIVIFLALDPKGVEVDLPLPDRYPDVEELSYLGGKSLHALLDAERRATREALRRAGRPSMTITLPRIDAEAIGELVQFLSIATVLAGALAGVNPLDQPGVEEGKRLTYGLMGRAGYPVP